MEQPTQCSCCDNFPDDILMLACNHDLCLNCAAKLFAEQNQQQKQNYLTCSICTTTTHLDHSSIYELEKLAITQHYSINTLQKPNSNNIDEGLNNNNISNSNNNNNFSVSSQQPRQKLHTPIKMYQKEPQTLGTDLNTKINLNQQPAYQSSKTQSTKQVQESNLNQSNLQKPLLNNSLTKAIQGFCQEHNDEEISYFCFDCKVDCVCSECVVHGVHKNHDVKTIKKTYPIINQKIQEYLSNLSYKVEQIQQRKQTFIEQKTELQDSNAYVIEQIKQSFNEIRQKIDLKEKQLIQECDQVLEQNFIEIDNFIYNLESKIESLISTQQLLNEQYQINNEVNLINFYAKNYQRLDEIVVKDEFEKKLLNDQLPCELVDHKEISEAIYKLSTQIMLIETKFDKNKLADPQKVDQIQDLQTQSQTKLPRTSFDAEKHSDIKDQTKYQFLSNKFKETYDMKLKGGQPSDEKYDPNQKNKQI